MNPNRKYLHSHKNQNTSYIFLVLVHVFICFIFSIEKTKLLLCFFFACWIVAMIVAFHNICDFAVICTKNLMRAPVRSQAPGICTTALLLKCKRFWFRNSCAISREMHKFIKGILMNQRIMVDRCESDVLTYTHTHARLYESTRSESIEWILDSDVKLNVNFHIGRQRFALTINMRILCMSSILIIIIGVVITATHKFYSLYDSFTSFSLVNDFHVYCYLLFCITWDNFRTKKK